MNDTMIPAALAREALLLRPRTVEHGVDRGLWPLVVIAIDDDHPMAAAVEHRLGGGETTVVLLDGDCHWSLLGDGPLLGLHIVPFDATTGPARVVVPAAPLRHELRLLGSGPTVGLTTVSRAARLRDGVDTPSALRELVLIRSHPAPELAAPGMAVAS